MTEPNFAPPDRSAGGLRTWQKVAIGCGGFMVLAIFLVAALLIGIAIGTNSAGQQVSQPDHPISQGDKPSSGQPTAQKESGTETAVVRVTGTKGLKFTGDIGSLEGSRSVEDTVPKEYDVQFKSGAMDFDSVHASFSRDFMDDSKGTLGVEIVYDGEVVKQSETNAQSGSVSVNWSP
jgi:hypothetical protein